MDGPRCGKPFFIETFFNCSAFDINNKTERIHDTWRKSLLSEIEKNKIGIQFYERKRRGESVGDKSYVENQQVGLLPVKWDMQKKIL